MSAILQGLKSLGAVRLAVMAAVGVGVLGLLAILAVNGGGGNGRMSLLYADLDLREAGQIVDQLDHQHIPSRVEGQGSTILVPPDQVSRARLLLAKEGLPSGGSVGYEIFDRADGLTANQFQEHINETRALEGELARTIRGIRGVRAVRVHLVLSHREPFARERQEAQASIVLTMAGAARMDNEGVQAILNLVAAAVPGLKPQNIAIIDARGDLLARAGQPVGALATAMSTEEIRHATEQRLSRAVEEMLERSLGAGHVRAEASVDMNFDQLHETQEKYDPDGQVARSQQSVTDNSHTTEANNTVSVQNNLPNADAGAPPSGSQQQRQEDTTNYEISKTVRTLVHDQPQIRRISLAVMVDEVAEVQNGKTVWRERTAPELARITALVRSAVGYDEKRGDTVDVVSMRFVDDPALAPASTGLFGTNFEKSDIMRLVQMGLFGLVAVLTVLLVLRPMAARLGLSPGTLLAGPSAGIPALAGPTPGSALQLAGGVSLASTLLAPPTSSSTALTLASAAPTEDESMVHLANIDGQLRASSLRRIAGMVDQHPEESLAIVRAWMTQEGP